MFHLVTSAFRYGPTQRNLRSGSILQQSFQFRRTESRSVSICFGPREILVPL